MSVKLVVLLAFLTVSSQDASITFRTFNPKGFSVETEKNFGAKRMIFNSVVHTKPKNTPLTSFFTKIKTDRKWIYENLDVALQPGDSIVYEVTTVNKKGGYRRIAEGRYDVTELEVSPYGDEDGFELELEGKLHACYRTLTNMTRRILSLRNEIEMLEGKNEMLESIIHQDEDKELNLCGVIPQDESARTTVRFILWEKLDLKPHIVSAVRLNSTCISFELETIDDKILVLQKAQENLKTTRITIS